MFENLSKDTRNALCWIGSALLVGIMWTAPAWLIVLRLI